MYVHITKYTKNKRNIVHTIMLKNPVFQSLQASQYNKKIGANVYRAIIFRENFDKRPCERDIDYL